MTAVALRWMGGFASLLEIIENDTENITIVETFPGDDAPAFDVPVRLPWRYCHIDDLLANGSTYKPRLNATRIAFDRDLGTTMAIWQEADGLKEGLHVSLTDDGQLERVTCYRGDLEHGLAFRFGCDPKDGLQSILEIQWFELGRLVTSARPDRSRFPTSNDSENAYRMNITLEWQSETETRP